jgi:hypothetical protein
MTGGVEMKKKRVLASVVMGAVAYLVLVPFTAKAATVKIRFRYTVKFTCGSVVSGGMPVVPGDYATSVNVQNGSRGPTVVRKAIALSFPPEAQGRVSDQMEGVLPPHGARQVDCGAIPSEFTFPEPPATDGYVEGYLVLWSTRPLQVTGVYTAAGGTGQVSVDVEKVPGQTLKRYVGDRDKLVICHVPPGYPDRRHTLLIDPAAWPIHEAHGDTLGRCE